MPFNNTIFFIEHSAAIVYDYLVGLEFCDEKSVK